MSNVPRVVLVVLDGFGERPETDGNAVRSARMPTFAGLYERYPHVLIGASGNDVGLPDGQMGNSEVGHLNLGAGRIVYHGDDLAHLPDSQPARAVRRLKLAHVPEDRHRMGMVVAFPACDTAILGYQDDAAINRGIILSRGAVIDHCTRLMEAYDVRPGQPLLKSANFSGGNQQKIVLGREMERDPDLLLVGQPTRGVDIGAIEFIHNQIVKMRDAGKAILLVSVELDEIRSLSDRILVMFDGAVSGERAAAETDERELGLLMAGVDPRTKGAA